MDDGTDWRVICAWCKLLLRGEEEAANTSHTICNSCAVKQKLEFEEYEETFLRETGGEG